MYNKGIKDLENGVLFMEGINEKRVLNFYLEEMDRDTIAFLKDKPWYRSAISEKIIKLREEEEMHNKITICKDLWKLLFIRFHI